MQAAKEKVDLIETSFAPLRRFHNIVIVSLNLLIVIHLSQPSNFDGKITKWGRF